MPHVLTRRRGRRKADVRPLLIKPADAAVRLNLAYDEVLRTVAREVFTVVAPHGRGKGKPVWLYADEVDKFGVGTDGRGRDRELAVRALRIETKRMRPDARV